MPFSRRFYPKRLTVMYAYILRMGGPGNRTHYPGVTSTMLYQRQRLTAFVHLEGKMLLTNLPIHLQSIRKVFRPLDFFHILLRYSLILKLIKIVFPPHQSPHNTP
jgi:hypothetical protein